MKRSTATVSRVSRLDVQQMRLITRTTRLHYLQGKRQAEIAEEMGISQASVSRFLSMAEEHGIVRTIVVPPEGLYPELEESLVEKYGLQSAYVVDISARETGLEGVVRTEAIVRTDGRLTDIRITDGLSYSCDKEVQRLLAGMPAWKPARRNGEPVEQKVYVQVRFKLKSL